MSKKQITFWVRALRRTALLLLLVEASAWLIYGLKSKEENRLLQALMYIAVVVPIPILAIDLVIAKASDNEAAKQQKEIDKLTKELDAAKQRLLVQESRDADRSLTQEQRIAIKTDLSGIPSQRFRVFTGKDNEEGAAFGAEIQAFLVSECGWRDEPRLSGPIRPGATPPPLSFCSSRPNGIGISIYVQTPAPNFPDPNVDTKLGHRIATIFAAAGVVVFPLQALGLSETSHMPGIVGIVVGTKPRRQSAQ